MNPPEGVPLIDEDSVDRIVTALRAALRRKPRTEDNLAGAVRVLAPYSPVIADAAADSLETLVRRRAFGRPLYAACARSCAQLIPDRAVEALLEALGAPEAGGLVTLSAAGDVSDARLAEPLQRAAALRNPLFAFGAELARVIRGESNGTLSAALAPKIKESHRIVLCSRTLAPLMDSEPLPPSALPALRVLRESERHLGRWLLIAELETRAGDCAALREAQARRRSGPESTRVAWTHVCWALGAQSPLPKRTSTDVVFRLSDRPSSEKDASFLFRMARAREPAAAALLESLCQGGEGAAGAIRAAAHLVDDYGCSKFSRPIVRAATAASGEKLRGLATASLFDIGERDLARQVRPRLARSRQISTVAWGALVQAVDRGRPGPVVTDATFRRLEQGLVA